MPLSGRRILLGVSGGIAAYKSAYLARRLILSLIHISEPTRPY